MTKRKSNTNVSNYLIYFFNFKESQLFLENLTLIMIVSKVQIVYVKKLMIVIAQLAVNYFIMKTQKLK